MGNYRFKLSDMIPNAWFYKLRDMGKGKGRKHASTTTTTFSKKKKVHPPSTTTTTTTTTTAINSPKPKQQCSTTPRKSYYFTRELNQISSKINHNSPRRIIISSENNNNNNSYCSPQEQPRKSSCSSTQRARRRRRTPRISSPKLVTSSVSAGCSCRTTTIESVWTKSDSPPPHHHHHHHDYSSLSSSSSSSQFGSSGDSEFHEAEFRTDHVLPTETSSFDEMVSLSTTTNTNTNNSDIVIDVDKNSLARKDDKLEGYEYDSFSDLDLPPIITKTSKPKTRISSSSSSSTTTATIHEEKESKLMKGPLKVKIVKEDTTESIEKKTHQHQQQRSNASVKGFSVSSPGVKLRINSPRLVGGRKVNNGRKSVSSAASSGSRRSISESFAIVKSSFNPQKDFRESMVEMIVENNIRASKDLEDLLACYLSLNSDEYHELIITVFKQIWFDLTEKR